MLSLTTDLEGSTEVGGLFHHPRERAEGLGLLLARSRYLYIRNHRARFGERIIAELRGVIDEVGGSPFWDGLAGRRSEEHTSELQSLMRITYAVFCLNKKIQTK